MLGLRSRVGRSDIEMTPFFLTPSKRFRKKYIECEEKLGSHGDSLAVLRVRASISLSPFAIQHHFTSWDISVLLVIVCQMFLWLSCVLGQWRLNGFAGVAHIAVPVPQLKCVHTKLASIEIIQCDCLGYIGLAISESIYS